jgi:hypothetical protein
VNSMVSNIYASCKVVLSGFDYMADNELWYNCTILL